MEYKKVSDQYEKNMYLRYMLMFFNVKRPSRYDQICTMNEIPVQQVTVHTWQEMVGT
jgi:hypothetical protein